MRRKIISLWDHYLTREEYEFSYPQRGSKEYINSCEKFDLFLRSIASRFKLFENKEKIVKPDELLKYSPNIVEYKLWELSNKVEVIINSDFCIELKYEREEDIEDISKLMKKIGLKEIREENGS